MTKAVNPVPEGYHTVTPYFTVADAGGFLDFLKQVFDAEGQSEWPAPMAGSGTQKRASAIPR